MKRKNIFSSQTPLLALCLGCLFVLICLSSCDKAPSQSPTIYAPVDSNSKGIFICNEGNFQWGNASLSFYNSNTQQVKEDVFKSYNLKSVGDVLQSMCIINQTAYLVVNNSQKIELMNTKTFKSTGTIGGFNSPRYFLRVSSNLAYVSDLYENAVWMVNLSSQKIEGKINVPAWTEEMALWGTKVFVCGKNSPYVYVIESSTSELIDSISVGFGPQNILEDKNQKFWVLTTGKGIIPPQLHRIDPINGIETTLSFKTSDAPTRLICNTTKNNLYWVNKDIFQMPINATILPASPLVQAGLRNIYSLGFDPNTKELLASDAKDYVQKSEVYRFDSTGNLLGSFKTGINTGFFLAK